MKKVIRGINLANSITNLNRYFFSHELRLANEIFRPRVAGYPMLILGDSRYRCDGGVLVIYG